MTLLENKVLEDEISRREVLLEQGRPRIQYDWCPYTHEVLGTDKGVWGTCCVNLKAEVTVTLGEAREHLGLWQTSRS